MEVKGKKITILGAQRSGMALAKLIVRLGGNAKISEQKSEDFVPLEFKNWARK